MNSLEALTRILARQSPKPRARRRSKATPISEAPAEPVASTSTAEQHPDAKETASAPPSQEPQQHLSRQSRGEVANLLYNSLPVRVSVALLLCIRRIIARLLGIPLPLSPDPRAENQHEVDEPPPPSYEAATNQPEKPPKSAATWGIFSRRQPASAVEHEKHRPMPSAEEKRIALLSRPKTLVLDLDETLIHSTNNLTGLSSPSGKWNSLSVRVVEVVLDSKSVVYHVYKRPWVDLFLKKVAAWYTVVIFTASIQEYADPVIDWLDGGKGLVTARLFRESCDLYRGAYRKDLSVISKDLSRLCLVDNSPAAYALNPANGIPIEGWVGDTNDEGLLDLLPLLDSLRFTSDVRRVLGLRGFSQQPHSSVASSPSSAAPTSFT